MCHVVLYPRLARPTDGALVQPTRSGFPLQLPSRSPRTPGQHHGRSAAAQLYAFSSCSQTSWSGGNGTSMRWWWWRWLRIRMRKKMTRMVVMMIWMTRSSGEVVEPWGRMWMDEACLGGSKHGGRRVVSRPRCTSSSCESLDAQSRMLVY